MSRASQDDTLRSRRNEARSQRNQIRCLRNEFQQLREERNRLDSTLRAWAVAFTEDALELDSLAISIESMKDEYDSQTKQIETLEKKRETLKLKLRLVEIEQKLLEGENIRRELRNTIQELKGNMRVFCRVRPLLSGDGTGVEYAITYPTSEESKYPGVDSVQIGQNYIFMFDKVFTHEASQQDVFVEISQLVQSALDGYKVCIFAYGQSGSGKTYTMMGRPEDPDEKGLIPRSLEQIFRTSQSLQTQGWKYEMQASMLEIYDETIQDLVLVSANRSSCSDQTWSESAVKGKQYSINHDANGNTTVSGLTIVDVSSIAEISALLRQAAQCRSVGKTQMNEQSSRSHMVFTLRIHGVNVGIGQENHGVLNLIDLAGSGRLSKSGVIGERLKETQAINRGLSSLADVISALAKKDAHVPYRNSKLTHLLQPCLGGDSKTLMFVNISPDPSSTEESLFSLRFASRVNACKMGVRSVSESPHQRALGVALKRKREL